MSNCCRFSCLVRTLLQHFSIISLRVDDFKLGFGLHLLVSSHDLIGLVLQSRAFTLFLVEHIDVFLDLTGFFRGLLRLVCSFELLLIRVSYLHFSFALNFLLLLLDDLALLLVCLGVFGSFNLLFLFLVSLPVDGVREEQ